MITMIVLIILINGDDDGDDININGIDDNENIDDNYFVLPLKLLFDRSRCDGVQIKHLYLNIFHTFFIKC